MSIHRRTPAVTALLLLPLALACREGTRTTTTAGSGPVVSASVPESRTESGTISPAVNEAPVSYADAEQAFQRRSYGEAA
jgi:hypothetical protein